ncbi:NifU family protein [Candidatus Dependentiae bacterium]|nr:NifU family protein [Candidatus Dependentiae bacterium]
MTREMVEDVLVTIRPHLQAHGGDIALVDVTDQEISVRLKGACIGCPLSFYTMTMGVEQELKKIFPSLLRVIVVE